MINTNHIPDSITPVIGWRAWEVTEDGWLLSLTNHLYDSGRWFSSRETARCHLSAMHPAPQPDCSCGFYALPTMTEAEQMLVSSWYMATHCVADEGTVTPRPRIACSAMGTVELTGNICAHEGGWRAQYAKVRSINYLRIFFPSAVDHQVALDYIRQLSNNYPGTMSPVAIVDMVGEDPAPEPRRTISLDDDQEIHDCIPLGFSKGEAVLRGRQWIYQLRLMDITGGRFENFERNITLFDAEYFRLQELELEQADYERWWNIKEWAWLDVDRQLYRPDGGIHTTLSATSPWDPSYGYSLGGTIVVKFDDILEDTNNVRAWKGSWNGPRGNSGGGEYAISRIALDARDYARENDVTRYNSYMSGAFLNPRPDQGIDLKQLAMDLLEIKEEPDAK